MDRIGYLETRIVIIINRIDSLERFTLKSWKDAFQRLAHCILLFEIGNHWEFPVFRAHSFKYLESIWWKNIWLPPRRVSQILAAAQTPIRVCNGYSQLIR